MRIRLFTFSILCFLGLACSLQAQEITGTLSGTVLDSTGGSVPQATVTLVRQQTGAIRQTTASDAGVFFFNSLPIGAYTLTVESAGFKKYESSGIELHVNDKIDLHVKLTVGEVSEKILVSGETPLLQTESAELSTLIGSKQINDLPLNGRDFNQLVDLVPGVAPDNGRVNGGVGLDSDVAVSISGAQSNSNLYLVDGEYDQDSGGNVNLLVTPSVDSIEEFKILRNTYSAEFGGATGGVVNVVTKSGGQDFHGSLYDFVRNDLFDANDTFNNRTGTPKSKLRQNNYGFAVGGPVSIPKIFNRNKSSDFFFISDEWFHETRGATVTATVPTARQRQGIFSAPTFDPQEFVLNEADVTSPIDSNAVAFLQRYPLPNANISNGFNWIASINKPGLNNTQLYRWDHNFGSKFIFTARYIGLTANKKSVGTELFGFATDFPALASDWSWTGKNVILKLTAQLASHVVNDFQFGYSNNAIRQAPASGDDQGCLSFQGGGNTCTQPFTYTPLFPAAAATAFYPALNFNSGSLDGFTPLGLSAPWGNRTDNFQYKDDVSYTFGRHNLKFGGFLRFNRKTEPANGFGNDLAGQFTFGTFSDFLQGNFQSFQEEQTLNAVHDRQRDYALYVQDTWKISQNVTLDLGLRYQILAQGFSALNNISNFRPSAYVASPTCTAAAFDANGNVDPTLCNLANGLVTPGQSGVSASTLPNHYNDWEPRVGIAWQPRFAKKMVVRSGFGIFSGREALSQTSALGSQLPFDLSLNVTNGSFSNLNAPFNSSLNLPQPPSVLHALASPYFGPSTYQYNLGVQYQIASSSVIDVNYVGNHGIHLGQNVNINQVPDSARLGIANFESDGCTAQPTPCIPTPDSVRPFLGFNTIIYNQRAGTSRYNALQVGFQQRLSHGLEFQAAYTHSRNITNVSNQDSEAGFQPVLNANNLPAEKGLASQDTPNSLSVDYIWELPYFAGSHGIARQVLHGWKVVGISTFRSGLPTNVCLSNDIAGTGTNGFECQRPDLVGNPNLPKSQRTQSQYFNTAAFVQPQPGTFGNASRNLVRLPGINNWDFSVFKAFDIPWFGKKLWFTDERAKLEFRTEMFNVFNHAQYDRVDTTFVAGDLFGAAGAPTSGSTFGNVTSDRAPREIQLALKLTF